MNNEYTKSLYKLQPTWKWKFDGDKCVLSSNFFGKEVSLSGPAASDVASLLEILKDGAGSASFASIALRVTGLSEDAFNSLLKYLVDEGIVVLASNDQWEAIGDGQFDRQIRFFNSFHRGDHDGTYFNERLQSKRIAIVGMGGYGNWLALLCSRLGVREIVGIDFDTVELSNLGRQILFDKSCVGQPKVLAAQRALANHHNFHNFNPVNSKITSAKDLYPLLTDVDLVFNPFGFYQADVARKGVPGFVVEAAFTLGIPSLTIGASMVGPLTSPGKSPCYFCCLENPEILSYVTSTSNDTGPVKSRQFAPIISTVCSYAVWEASLFLSQASPPQTLAGIVIFDWLSSSFAKLNPIEMSAKCSLCTSVTKSHTVC
jgi:hypothetical protein